MKKLMNKPDTSFVLSVTLPFFCKMIDRWSIMRL